MVRARRFRLLTLVKLGSSSVSAVCFFGRLLKGYLPSKSYLTDQLQQLFLVLTILMSGLTLRLPDHLVIYCDNREVHVFSKGFKFSASKLWSIVASDDIW